MIPAGAFFGSQAHGRIRFGSRPPRTIDPIGKIKRVNFSLTGKPLVIVIVYEIQHVSLAHHSGQCRFSRLGREKDLPGATLGPIDDRSIDRYRPETFGRQQMKNTMILAAVAAMLFATSGCSNGPLKRFFSGGACNSCQPVMGGPCSSNVAGSCSDGSCGTGVFDQNPASISGAQLGTTGGDIYYNDPTGGIPSGDAYGNSGMVTPPTIGPMNGN